MNAQNITDNRTLPEERRQAILELVTRQGRVTVSDLQRRFRISAMTVRRDLEVLERAGHVLRTHGGALLRSLAQQEDSFVSRLQRSVQEKERLAERALAHIAPGESLFLDSSTTAYYLARKIVEEQIRLTIITNSIPIMQLISESVTPTIELIGIGGTLRHATRSFVGTTAVCTVNHLYADKTIFSVKGVTTNGDLTDPDPQEAEVKRTMIQRSREAILLIDESKLMQYGLHVVTSVKALARILVAGRELSHLDAIVGKGVPIEQVLI